MAYKERLALGVTLRRFPKTTLLIPILVLGALLSGGLYAISISASNSVDGLHVSAALDVAVAINTFASAMNAGYELAATVGILLQYNPDWPTMQEKLVATGSGLLQLGNGTFLAVQVVPQGIVALVFPTASPYCYPVGTDMPASPRGGIYLEQMRSGQIQGLGPVPPDPTADNRTEAFRIVQPVFITDVDENETFGVIPHAVSTYITKGLCDFCYNATTRTKYWGSAFVSVNFTALFSYDTSAYTGLKDRGYTYQLTRPGIPGYGETAATVMIATNGNPVDPATASFTFGSDSSTWTLQISPRSGWQPSWLAGAQAGVVLAAVLIAGLVMVMLVTWVMVRSVPVCQPALFDRTKPGVTKSQVGFFDFVAQPLFNIVVQVFPAVVPAYHGLHRKYLCWKNKSTVV